MATPIPVPRPVSPGSPRPTLIPGFSHLLHGGDYNPDQWLDRPEVIDDDFRLMRRAGCNTFAVGIFAWTSYERAEGVFDFTWLDGIMDRMADAGHKVILATPSGAKPAWMARAYPEIRRVTRDGLREPPGGRHNHCWTSPVYREKVRLVNTELARRYRRHPALGMWHLSNEYGGAPHGSACHCDLCLAAWQAWLRQRHGSLDALNRAWWAPFWSHTFTAWAEIDPRDQSVDGMHLDWMRFLSWQIADFMQWEMQPLREFTPEIPCTTNFMGFHPEIDYLALGRLVDVVADDQYPAYHPDDLDLPGKAVRISFKDDLFRAMRPDRPWMLMESCPDAPQWKFPMRLKSAAIHRLEMLQALAHGAEGTCYFQWRKGLGSCEKFHGAVVDHSGRDDTRVFRSVADLGASYAKLAPILGSRVVAEVAMLFSWEARWGLRFSHGPGQCADYEAVAGDHYRPHWEAGVPVDVIAPELEMLPYRLLVAPMLWMLKPGVADRLRRFVEGGGVLLATFNTGICDEHNLCFPGGWPGDGLMALFGVRNEEDDRIGGDLRQRFAAVPGNALGLDGAWTCAHACAVLHPEPDVEVAASFADGFCAGLPALTARRVGKGLACYLATHPELDGLRAIAAVLRRHAGVAGILPGLPPRGVMVQRRIADSGREFIVLGNFTGEPQSCPLGRADLADLETGAAIPPELVLSPFQSCVLASPGQ
jgi:beta-galactosidase